MSSISVFTLSSFFFFVHKPDACPSEKGHVFPLHSFITALPLRGEELLFYLIWPHSSKIYATLIQRHYSVCHPSRWHWRRQAGITTVQGGWCNLGCVTATMTHSNLSISIQAASRSPVSGCFVPPTQTRNIRFGWQVYEKRKGKKYIYIMSVWCLRTQTRCTIFQPPLHLTQQCSGTLVAT